MTERTRAGDGAEGSTGAGPVRTAAGDGPEGVTVGDRGEWCTRAETPGDLAAVRAVHVDAFPTAEEADLVDALRADPAAWIPELSRVAVHGGSVVSHCLLTRCHIDHTPALSLAPVATLTARQSSGAGSAVIRACLNTAEELGERYVVVLGHPDYYPRFGFERASTHGVRISIKVPDDALMALALPGAGPIPSGLIRYADPFGI